VSDPFFTDDDIASFQELATSGLQDRCSYTPPASPTGPRDEEGQLLPPSGPTTITGIACLYFDLRDEALRRPTIGTVPTELIGEVWLGLDRDGAIATDGLITLTDVWGRALPTPLEFKVNGAVSPGRTHVVVPVRRLMV
jgi:hypothetical protein